MFSKLPESLPAHQRRRLAIAASALAHAAVLWSAAHLTAAARPAPPRPEVIPMYFPVRHPDQTVHSVAQPHTGPSTPDVALPVIRPIQIPLPAPLPFPATPDQWPDHHSSAEQAGPVGPVRASGVSPGTTGQPFSAGEVDRAAAPRAGAPSPVYPPDLQAAGIEGIVAVEFVVDSAGVADDRHIRIVSSDYPAFSAAARAVIARTRYFPAEAHGHRVAQLVEQSFVFRITR